MSTQGYHDGAVYRDQGGKLLVASSSGEIRIKPGAKFNDQNTVLSASAATITNRGLNVLSSTKAAVYTLSAPVRGVAKEIVSRSSFLLKVKCAAGTLLGSTLISVASIAASSKGAKRGMGITLRGHSTTQWYVTGVQSTAQVTFSSAT